MSKFSLSFEIPGLPFLPNRATKNCWQEHNRLAKLWKKKTTDAILENLKVSQLALTPLTKAKLTMTRCSSFEPDYDGLVISFKHVLDALVMNKIIVNDKPSIIGAPVYTWEVAPPTRGKVRVLVESVDEESNVVLPFATMA